MGRLDFNSLQKFWNKIKNHVQTSLQGYAKTSDIPDTSNFVSKDENGDVRVESLQVDDGITCVGVLDVQEGYSARFFSNDNSKKVALRCDDNGKLTLDGKEVATVDDIPSGGGNTTIGDTLRGIKEIEFDNQSGNIMATEDGLKVYAQYDLLIKGRYTELSGEENLYISSPSTNITGVSSLQTINEGIGQAGQVLTTNGETVYWGNASGGDSSIIDLGAQENHKDAQQAMVDYVSELTDEQGCVLFKYHCTCSGNACLAIVHYYHSQEDGWFSCSGTVYDSMRSFRDFFYHSDEGFTRDGCWLTIASFDESTDYLQTEAKTVLDAINETHSIALNGYIPNCYAFMPSEDENSWVISRDYDDSRTEALIPSVISGKPVTSIGDHAFYNCNNLINVAIPDSITSIESHAFYSCSSLPYVNIPNSVTTIGEFAFGQCNSLNRVIIPNSVTSMGNRVFYNCPNLTIYCEAPSKPDGWDDNWNKSNCPVVWGTSLDIVSLNDKLKALEARIAALEGN